MTAARTRLLRSIAVLTVAGLMLLGCGGDGSDASSGSAGHNDVDVAFATEMVPHHEQALLMVDMVDGRSPSAEFEHLTQHIAEAQAPEIDEMTGWLEAWGEAVPRSYGHMMGGGSVGGGSLGSGSMGSGSMGRGSMGSGMMSDDDLDDLARRSGTGFEEMWLRMMISHHQGAIDMARAEIADGEFGPAIDLAHSIATSQQAEIEQMEQMLSR